MDKAADSSVRSAGSKNGHLHYRSYSIDANALQSCRPEVRLGGSKLEVLKVWNEWKFRWSWNQGNFKKALARNWDTLSLLVLLELADDLWLWKHNLWALGRKKGGKFMKIHFVSFAALTNLWFTVTVAGNNLVAFNCVFFSVWASTKLFKIHTPTHRGFL